MKTSHDSHTHTHTFLTEHQPKSMGCVSSKHIKKDILCGNHDHYPNHVVSLRSSTYGVLNLDKETIDCEEPQSSVKECVVEVKKSPPREEPEIIDACVLMKDLEEEEHLVVKAKKSPKSRIFVRGLGDLDAKTPLKFFNHVGSPRKLKRSVGKENKGRLGNGTGTADYSPNQVLRARNSIESPWRITPSMRISNKGSPSDAKCESFRADSVVVSSRRRSLGPLFDPELVASLEKELSEEEEQIKKMISSKPTAQKQRNSQDSEAILETFETKCPPGGENAVVIYTTTLRGIRKTFEDCNIARSIIESHCVQLIERDVSMDSGFREELRRLMGTKTVKVPLVFVKGRLIGGADEIVKLDEEGKLGILLSRMPKAVAVCQGCAGIRFIMCMDCSGSSKVLGEDGKKSVKCGDCNENGLVQCPLCC